MEEKKDSPEFPGAYEIRKESNDSFEVTSLPLSPDFQNLPIQDCIEELVEAHLEKLLNKKELEIQEDIEEIRTQLEEIQAQLEELKEKPFWM